MATIKTVKQALAASGITPNTSYTGEETTDDFILGISTDGQTSPPEYTVCMDHIKQHAGSLNTSNSDSTYIRNGTSTLKTSAQRTFSITGDRRPGDAFQAFALANKMLFATGQDCVVDYVYFSARTGIGETGKASLIVTEDVGGEAGNKATFAITLAATEKPAAYTYKA